MHSPRKRMSRQRGFTLTEVLVASAILVMIMAGALLLYERGTLIFKQGNEASELQQNTRVAYDRMLADIRMAGFDYQRAGSVTAVQQPGTWTASQSYSAGTIIVPMVPNGHTYRAFSAGTSGAGEPSWPTGIGAFTAPDGTITKWQENGGAVYQQPDEQIEYAGKSAITIRANFDYSANEPADGDHGRETNLETAQFPIVTTGNDEIVTYALVSANGSNPDTVSFYADVNNGGSPSRTCYPGGNAERLISIPGVDLSNNNPPYTLYRFTLNDAGAVVRTPLADNIRSLSFLYYMDVAATQPLTDTTGAVNQNIGGGGQYNPNAPTASIAGRVTRGKIRAVRVRLMGMNANKDANFADTSPANGIMDTTGALTSDTIAPNFRKMTMDTLIVPRNLGLKGMPLVNSNPPLPPTINSVCYGYCGIAVVTWTPDPNSPLSSYVVQWDTSATGSFSSSVAAGTTNSWAVDLTQGNLSTTYYFRVMAQNQAGTALSTNTVSASVANATMPGVPTSFVVSNGTVAGKVNISWSTPTGNDPSSASPTCTGGATPANASFYREVKGYRIYRDTNAAFVPPGQGTLVVDENATGPGAPATDAYGNFTWSDTTASSCTQYYYRIRTVEWCVAANADNTTNDLNTALSAFYPATSSNGTPGETKLSTPLVPINLTVDTANSSCTGGICTITLNWSKVTQDTSTPAQPITITTYDVQRQQLLPNPSPPPLLTPIASQTFQATGTTNTIVWQDTNVPQIDPGTGEQYTYKYSVRATQSPCPASGWTSPVQYPPPCSFTGAVITEAGASSGDGLTYGSAWVMNAGDSITVTPPAGTTFVNTTGDIFNAGTPVGSLGGSPSALSPAIFTWADLAPGTTYSLLFTMTSSTGCTQQITRFVTQETPPGCTLSVGSSVMTLLNGSPGGSSTPVIRLDLVNSDTTQLTLVAIDFSYQLPNHVDWMSTVFPSGNAVAMNGTTGLTNNGSSTVNLSPKPSQLTTPDITVLANSTLSLTLNMKATANASITTSAITSICVHYTRTDVPGQTFLCRIVPSAGAGNPFTSCN